MSPLPANFTADSAHRWTPDGSLGDLRLLVGALRALGVEPTDAAAHDSIRALAVASFPVPGRILGQAPKEVLALAEQAGIRSAARQATGTTLFQFQQQAHLELQQSMTAEASSYIEQLRPAFDEAAAGARRCSDLGIQPSDSPEEIMERGADAVSAWVRFKTTDLVTLEHIAGARILMSRALGIPPVNRHIGSNQQLDYGRCFTRPNLPFGPDDRRTKINGWRRWLTLAANLYLTDLDELS